MIGFRKVRKPTFRTVKSGLKSVRLRNHFIRPKPMSLEQLKRHLRARLELDRESLPFSLFGLARILIVTARNKTDLKRKLQLELPRTFPDSAFIGF